MATIRETQDQPTPASGRSKVRRQNEETKEIDIAAPELDEFLDDDSDANPGDRRRDPLRRAGG